MSMIALSIRQPFANRILSGEKVIEYRTIPTKKRERVYIYASKTQLPVGLIGGVIIGSVEIIDCTETEDWWLWHLANPVALVIPVKPELKPQPVFFRPFALITPPPQPSAH